MRGHHLGNPKTPKSRRTVTISSEIARLLSRLVEGKAADFVFVTPTGRPIHNADFYERVWYPHEEAPGGRRSTLPLPRPPPHPRSLAGRGGAPLPHIQARLGHESITTTIDTYGHLLPVGDELIADIIDTALRGGEIRPAMRLISGGSAATKS